MTKFRLKWQARLLLFLLFIGIVAYGLSFTGAYTELMAIFTPSKEAPGKVPMGETKTAKLSDGTVVTTATNAMNISLDEWVGWKSVIDANGGRTTAKGSIFDKMGLKVNINIINDATQSSTALINKNIDAAGYTINRYAFLYPKFLENKTPVKMAFITNYSNGGDGIVAKKDIAGIEGLVGKKVGIPRFSEAQTIVEWLMAKSSLTDAQVKEIRAKAVYFNDPSDCAKAFFAGQIDAAATWQPYLSQAQDTAGAKVLFSTKAATNIVLDGIVFREDYMKANPENVKKFIEGTLMAMGEYKTSFGPIKDTMEMFATETNDSIKAMTDDAALADHANNVKLLNGVAQSLYVDMANIWKALGEKADPGTVGNAFDSQYITALTSKFASAPKVQDAPKFTEAQREEAKKQDNNQALLTQKLSINFEVNAASIKEDSYPSLNKFAETAKILNGVVIQIEGNTDSTGGYDLNKKLSADRAKAVATYLQFQGVDATRFVVIGNGPDKSIADNNTEDGRAANRRTDAFFKVVK